MAPPARTQDHCDAALSRDSQNPLAYRLRGDRCEGVYAQDVAGTVLRLVSFTQSFENFDPSTEQPLTLEWTPFGTADVQLRAQSLRSQLYYRMDSRRPAGSTSYAWPPALLERLEVRQQELGVVSWTTQKVGERSRDIYLPLVIRQHAEPSPDRYRVVLMPGAQFEEVFISLAPVDDAGQTGAFLMDNQPLNLGYYPAGRPIVLTLPVLHTAGIYRLEVGAELTSGGASVLSASFFHSGSQP